MLFYTKNKEVHVFEGPDNTQRILARMTDFCFDGEIEVIASKSMEILEISGKIKNQHNDSCLQALPLLEKFKGRRIGGGITKMVYGTIGRRCPCLASLVMECFEGAILGMTAGPLEKAVPHLFKSPGEFTKKKLIKFMPHLKNSCCAYTMNPDEQGGR
ncbi:MAG: hypothetical protein ACTSRB_10810 [Candidatus Helarchaeota archaeon]